MLSFERDGVRRPLAVDYRSRCASGVLIDLEDPRRAGVSAEIAFMLTNGEKGGCERVYLRLTKPNAMSIAIRMAQAKAIIQNNVVPHMSVLPPVSSGAVPVGVAEARLD